MEHFVHLSGHRQGVGPWKFLDDKQETGLVVNDPVADEQLMIFHHLGHVTQAQPRAIDDHLGQVMWR
jgi:hypothetical protein